MTTDDRRIHTARMTADVPAGTVVFLIGMRVNSFRSIRHWWPVFMAMPRMLREVHGKPGSGFLHARTWMSWRLVMVQQYWQSMDDLMAYARSVDQEHFPAWKAFNRRAKGNASTGIWHEAYVIDPVSSHMVYVNMPAFGIAAATSHVPVTSVKPDSPAQVTAR